MRRYSEILIESEDGIQVTLDEDDGRLIVRAIKSQDAKAVDGVKDEIEIKEIPDNFFNYKNPPIPDGYEYISGKWNDGFTIERKKDGSQFVWVPVGYLDPKGILDGKDGVHKFGRRNFRADTFLYNGFFEEFTNELEKQFESVNKYGGFYVSKYNIVKDDDNTFKSIPNHSVFLTNDYDEAYEIASEFEMEDSVKSHLIFGAEYDTILAWFIKSGVMSQREVEKDSTEYGNYWNSTIKLHQHSVTGMEEKWTLNGICDLAGNYEEWTQEGYCRRYRNLNHVIRGGNYNMTGYIYPISCRRQVGSDNKKKVSLRIALWVQ